MANPEHLEILAQGAEKWNQWREDNPGVVPDLSGAVLTGANLGEANLSEANLNEANLSGADLYGVDLSMATVNGAIFGNNDLSSVKGLDTVKHQGPSTIGIDTIYNS